MGGGEGRLYFESEVGERDTQVMARPSCGVRRGGEHSSRGREEESFLVTEERLDAIVLKERPASRAYFQRHYSTVAFMILY